MQFPQKPFDFFNRLYSQIQNQNMAEPSAMVLATASADGKPSARVVLLKGVDENGFVFYTNLASRKAQDLQENPYAALCFYWESISYQVRVEGEALPVSSSEADAYFATRPKGSQIGAWASKQSSELASRHTLEARVIEYEKKFKDKDVPRPTFWSGFRLVPDRFEFWQRREDRLHERILYINKIDGWDVKLLYP